MNTPIRVLLIEDSESDAALLMRHLKQEHFEPGVRRVETAEELRAALATDSWDIVLSDYSLPSFNAIGALEIVRQTGLDLPFIVISGSIGEDLAVRIMKDGAQDYLLKNNLARFGPTVRRELEEASQRRQRRAAEAAEQRLEQDLRESQNLLAAIMETVQEVFWMVGVDLKKLHYISPSYERVWGRSCRSLYEDPRSFVEAIHPEDRPAVLAALQHREQFGQTFTQEYRIVRPDGALRWISDHGFPVREPGGPVTRYVGCARDITEHKELERQFLRAQRLENLGRLAGGIAHDLNNVLAPILMSLEILRAKYGDGDDAMLLDSLADSAKRGAGIVKQVLTFARGVEGQKLPLQLGHLVKEMARIIAETFPKKIRLDVHIPPRLWLVSGDATHLHQVLLNLCVNARDAMPQGGLLTLALENVQFDELCASQTPGAKPGPYVRLRVADSGVGIPPENLEKIFDPFFTTKGPEEGTGLGLSTVLGIVKSHGGFLSVESQVGVGTQFQVFVPAVLEPVTPVTESGTPAPAFGQGELILVVDDEPTIRDVTRKALEKCGYHVLTAHDGTEAIALYVEHRADVRLIITDLAMPVMDGETTIRALKKLNPSLPIIVASGQAAGPELTHPAELGVAAFLPKPYATGPLLAAIEKCLRG